MGKITLTPIEMSLMGKLSISELQQLTLLRDDAIKFVALENMINRVVEIEKNYSFLLNEDNELSVKHAFSRGKHAMGQQILRLIMASSSELARREEIQRQLKEKQRRESENG